MGMLFHRLLILLNEEDADSTYYHIAVAMLQNFGALQHYSISELAAACMCSKSQISKVNRYN